MDQEREEGGCMVSGGGKTEKGEGVFEREIMEGSRRLNIEKSGGK